MRSLGIGILGGFLLALALGACSIFGSGEGGKIRLPVGKVLLVVDALEKALTTGDANSDGFIDGAEWIIVTNAVLAEALRLSQSEPDAGEGAVGGVANGVPVLERPLGDPLDGLPHVLGQSSPPSGGE